MTLAQIRRVEFTSSTNCMTPLGVAYDFDGYLGTLARAQRLSLGTPGMSMGLEVSGTIGSPGLRVAEGVAFDGLGQMIVRADSTSASVDTGPAANTTSYLTMRFNEVLTMDGVDPNVAPCGMLLHLPVLTLEKAATFVPSPGRVILAMASFDANGNLTDLTAGRSEQLSRVSSESIAGALTLRSPAVNRADTVATLGERERARIAPVAGGLRIGVSAASDRIQLGTDRGGNAARIDLMADAIVSCGPSGTAAATLTTNGATGAGHFLTLSQTGRTMVELGTSGTGNKEAGMLALGSALGRTTATMGSAASGGGELTLNDATGRELVQLGVLDGQAGEMRLTTAAGAEIASIGPAEARFGGNLKAAGQATVSGDLVVQSSSRVAGSLEAGWIATGNNISAGGQISAQGWVTSTGINSRGQIQAQGEIFADGGLYVNSGGSPSATVSSHSEGYAIWLYNNAAANVATIAANAGGGNIWLESNEGVYLTQLGSAQHGGALWIKNRADKSVAFLGTNTASGGSLIIRDPNGNDKLWLDGNGAKQFVMPHPEDDTKNIIYACIEGPEAAAYIRGRGELEGGSARVRFPRHFILVTNETTVTVQLTPRSAASKGLAVVKSDAEGFDVAELFEGTGSYGFDYFVSGVRRGFEDFQPVVAKGQSPMEASESPVLRADDGSYLVDDRHSPVAPVAPQPAPLDVTSLGQASPQTATGSEQAPRRMNAPVLPIDEN